MARDKEKPKKGDTMNLEELLKNDEQILRASELISKLTSDQKREMEIVLGKILSGEPITERERIQNPEMWSRAERHFDFPKSA